MDAAVGAHLGQRTDDHGATVHEAEPRAEDVLGDGDSQFESQPVVRHFQYCPRDYAPGVAVGKVL